MQAMPQPADRQPSPLRAEVIDLVDFKWLMASEGHRVDMTRLQTDRAYARGCLALAGGSTCGTLRAAAERLRQNLRVVSSDS